MMQTGIQRRLRSLEQAAARNAHGLFIVTFQDGRKQAMLPGDAIAAVHEGNVYQVDSIPGQEAGNGLLLELLKGLLQ